MRALPWSIVVLIAACSDRAAPASQPPPARSERGRARAHPRAPADTACTADDDCELVPVVTCCGECVPVPPFESVTRAAIDTLLLETEERCLRDDRPCPACARPPRGCSAAARCVEGRCTFVATGCELPTT